MSLLPSGKELAKRVDLDILEAQILNAYANADDLADDLFEKGTNQETQTVPGNIYFRGQASSFRKNRDYTSLETQLDERNFISKVHTNSRKKESTFLHYHPSHHQTIDIEGEITL